MQPTIYNSVPGSKKSTLAEASWEVFSPFLSRYQWAFDDPANSPRKAEILSALKNRGKDGCCVFHREYNQKYVLRHLRAWVFEKAISQHCKVYYVSFGKYALLYFDIDLHYAWQTQAEGQKAKDLIERLFAKFFGESVIFWCASSRGINGYLKVNLQREPYDEANALFARLEKALQGFLAHYGNLADFEIKGRVGFLDDDAYEWKQYGKLPIHHHDWNFQRLAEFKDKPLVSIHRLEQLCLELERQLPAGVLAQHKAYKKSLGNLPIVKDGFFLVTPEWEKALEEKHGDGWRWRFADRSEGMDGDFWLALKYHRPGEIPLTEQEWRAEQRQRLQPMPAQKPPICPVRQQLRDVFERSESPEAAPMQAVLAGLIEREDRQAEPKTPRQQRKKDRRPKAQAQPLKVNLNVEDLSTEPDSFERQRQALLRYSRYLKRVPSLEEALAYIRENNLFTGAWEQNLTRRKARVGGILQFIEQTFDTSKLANGSVNVGKYDEWARKKFPNGLTGAGRRDLSEEGEIVQAGNDVHVPVSFVAVFMAVAEFTLLIDKNEDGSLPHNRAEELWQSLWAKGIVPVAFDSRKWAVCRDELERYGVIVVTDRSYGPGKAMRWDVGVYFPGLGLWKTPKQPSLFGPVPLAQFLGLEWKTKKQEHNTLLQSQSARNGQPYLLALSRPPP